MIDANLRGKLRRDGCNSHERSEDLLTSTVFGFLRYLDFKTTWVPLMRKVRPVSLEEDKLVVETDDSAIRNWLPLETASSCEVRFWPSFGTWGQPDLVVIFRDADRQLLQMVVIEAKLHSGKSGEADDAGEVAPDDDAWEPDQLIRYWKGARTYDALPSAVSRTVVYFTAHTTPPVDDLKSSLTGCRSMRLGWACWHDVWRVLAPLARAENCSLATVDLVRLLEHLGLSDLIGFHQTPPVIPRRWHFWKHPFWFTSQPPLISLDIPKSFWREHGR